jgi:hypothetical protein
MDARVCNAIAIIVNQVTRKSGVSTAQASQLFCEGLSAAQDTNELER